MNITNENESIKLVNVDELGVEIAKNMPVKMENANANASESVNANANANVDASGNVFNIEKHKVDENGKPRLNRKGNFVLKGRGRNANANANANENENANANANANEFNGKSEIPDLDEIEKEIENEDNLPENKLASSGKYVPDEYDQAAFLYFNTGTAIVSSVLSDEWFPENDEEAQSVIRPLAGYLRAKGDVDLTPGQLTALALIVYAGKRVNKPTTKERLTLFFVKVKSWLKSKKENL